MIGTRIVPNKFKRVMLEIQSDSKDEPPIKYVFLVNPEIMDFNFTSKFSNDRTRWDENSAANGGYITQFHHDELTTIDMSGKSALFYTKDGLNGKAGSTDVDGLTRMDTVGYQEMQKLVAIYRNNGMRKSSVIDQYSPKIKYMKDLYLYYGNYLYTGFFMSFNLSENDSKPYNFDFTFNFKVASTYWFGEQAEILNNILNTQSTKTEPKINPYVINTQDTDFGVA